MKKIYKAIAGLAIAGTLCAGAATFAACKRDVKSYNGEYHYANAWGGNDYGIKVRVSVMSDKKGDRIKSVEIMDSVYTEASDSNPDYGWDNKVWYDNVDDLLLSYRGRYIADVLVQSVGINTTNVPGQPESVTDDSLSITGATQGSGRLLLAVQHALADAAADLGYTLCEGEYHYPNAWAPQAPHYGIKVKVAVKDGKICKVGIVPSEYTSVSDGWGDKAIWNDGIDALLENYEGQDVEKILSVSVTVNTDKAPGQPESVADENLMITGATQGSGRLLLAVQNALTNAGFGYEVVSGEYHYANPWGGADYGIKVNVVVNGDVVKSVTVVDSDYTSVTDRWESKDIWINGLDGLLSKYEGKPIAELLAIDVAVNPETVGSADTYFSAVQGQPDNGQELGGLLITGATQGSGRLLLAVQDALSKLDGYEVLTGEYHYANPWGGADYGIKVKVVVKDGKVVCAKEANHKYTSATVSPNWDKTVWDNGLDELLSKYAGKTVEELLAIDVATNPETVGSADTYFSAVQGQPDNGQDLDGLVITGATQGSGRLLLAVQDALSKLDGYKVLTGEYHYANPYSAQAPDYGIKVKVVVKDGEVLCVKEANHKYTAVTDSWTDKQKWFDGYDELFNKYNGKTVEELLAIDVATNPETVGSADTYFSAVQGQPDNGQELDGLVITGATQGSGRLLLAVQDALSKLDEYEVLTGEYHYANPWGGADYGIKVKVVVKDNTVLCVKEANHDYTSVTDSWGSKDTWINGLDGLLSKYAGKTVEQLNAVTVTTNPETVGSADTYFSAVQGQPDNGQELDGLVITGATQGSGRLLLAVQNALSKLN